MNNRLRSLLAWSTVALLSTSCGKSDEGADPGGASSGSGGSGVIQPGETGSVCETASDCFPDVAAAGASGALQGEAMCLERVRGGYCTHTCQEDTDCCAVSGECTGSHPQVCSPFESTDVKMCFLTCEEADIAAVGAGGAGGASGNVDSDQAYCQRFAGSSFICRSSGGGKENRKICVPGDCGTGAGCATDADCATGLSCFAGVKGGYCGHADCATNADCGDGSSCVQAADGKNYCYKSCEAASDCSFCRSPGFYATCSDSVIFAEAGTTGSVCVPPN
jgi:hypothetical protein